MVCLTKILEWMSWQALASSLETTATVRNHARRVNPTRLVRSLIVFAALSTPVAAGAADGSEVIDCSRADTRVTLRSSARLDPACTWTRGVRILASDVVLDCLGARIASTDRQYGIEISAPTTMALTNITVRNCHVEGFLNSVRITREGFRDLAEGREYENAFSTIVIEDSTFRNSRGVGVFVDGYVTGVTLRRLRVEGAGSSGIYLEAGSKDNLVEDNDIVDNGFGENGPHWQPFTFGGLSFWSWGTGREGLSVDGSRFNRILNNRFSGNSYGGIFLYKNCGEYVRQRPQRWFDRRYGAHGNLIEGNSFRGGLNGVWIAARMSENTLPMECSDPQYLLGYSLDYASGNVVRNNLFQDVTYGVRVEDDDNVVTGNRFAGDGVQHAVVVGTQYRTTTLARPVRGAEVTENSAEIPANPEPYRWLYGYQQMTAAANKSLGEPARFCEGVPLATGPFVMAVTVVEGAPEQPPSTPSEGIPPPGPLPPCPCAGDCAGDGSVTVDEVLRGIGIALGNQDLSTCTAYDTDVNGAVTIDEIVQAIDATLGGCR